MLKPWRISVDKLKYSHNCTFVSALEEYINVSKFSTLIRTKIYKVRRNDIPVDLLQDAYLVGGNELSPTLEQCVNDTFN